MLGLVWLAAAVWWGFSLLRIAGVRLSAESRAVVGPIAGLVTGSWLLYGLAYLFGRLSVPVVLGAIGAFVAAGMLARRRPSPGSPVPARWFLATAAVVGGALGFMNLWGVMAPVEGARLVAAEHVWADLPFHSAIISTFGHSAEIPAMHPVALGEPLAYPFLVDFASGVLVWGGLGLRASVIVINLLVQLGFFCGVAALTHRLTRSVPAAVLATGVLFCLGNLGFLAIPMDVAAAGGPGAWITNLPWSYTGDALGDKGLERLGTGMYLGNPTFMFFMPRRSGAFGLAAATTLLILFDELLERRQLGTALLAGAVLGVMPRVHAHSVIALLAFVGVWCLLLPARKGLRTWRTWVTEWSDAAKTWVVVGIIALAIGLPQVIALRRNASGFMSWWLGWIGQPHEAFEQALAADGGERIAGIGRALVTLARFWLFNGGLLVLLLIPAWRAADRRLRFFYLPFAFLWVFGNVVRTQPWEWDNSNYFVYWQFGTTVLVAAYLAHLLGMRDGEGWRGLARRLAPAAGVACIVGLTLAGFLSFGYGAQLRHGLWTTQEADFAAEIRERTPEQAVVLTSNGHTHPVLALSGRQGFMGFTGWLLTHNIDWQSYEMRLDRMLGGDVGLMRELGIDYVVIGPWERSYADQRGFELAGVFEDEDTFDLVFRRTMDGREWELLRLVDR